jgi:hypothetical protein
MTNTSSTEQGKFKLNNVPIWDVIFKTHFVRVKETFASFQKVTKPRSQINRHRRMASSGMLRRVALVETGVSDELSASFIRVTRIGEITTTLPVTASVVPSSPILVTLMKEELSSSETLVPTRATWWNIPEDAILHSHRREDLKS